MSSEHMARQSLVTSPLQPLFLPQHGTLVELHLSLATSLKPPH